MKLRDIGPKLWWWKIWIRYCCWPDLTTKWLRRKYCHKGFHKLLTYRTEFDDGEKCYRFRYLQCRFCEYKFFASPRELKRYLRIKKKFNTLPRGLVKGLASSAQHESSPSAQKSACYRSEGRHKSEGRADQKPLGKLKSHGQKNNHE